MKNIINYYYNINILNLYEVNNKYYFNYKNNDYIFMTFDRLIEDAPVVYNIYLEMKKRRVITNEIILNKDNQILTITNGIPYILIKDNLRNKSININDIFYFQNNTYNIFNDRRIKRINYIEMWESKIDYYEEQNKSLKKQYKIIDDSIDFYIGLGENAISYLINNKAKQVSTFVSHRRIDINKGSFDYYNPVNYIIDSRVRDFSEYIKNAFFNDKINFDLVRIYLDYMNFNKDEYILFIGRLLFPTYYFDYYDLVVNKKIDESSLLNIIDKTNDYLTLVKKIFIYIIYQKKTNIPYIEWLIKEY